MLKCNELKSYIDFDKSHVDYKMLLRIIESTLRILLNQIILKWVYKNEEIVIKMVSRIFAILVYENKTCFTILL